MTNVAELVWGHASATPDRVALRAGSDEWSYGRLRERAGAVATTLAAEGVSPGDRVLLVGPTVPEFAAAYYGLHAAGAIAVTPNTMSTRAELEYVGGDAGCSLVLVWHEIGDAPARAAEAMGIPCRTLHPGLEDITGETTEHPAERSLDDTAIILYTSGTTGRPKGAELTHGNLESCSTSFIEVLEMQPDDRFATALPLFHIFGQAVVMGTVIRAGGSLSLIPRFTPEATLETLRNDQITIFAGVPTMYNAMLHAKGDFGPQDFTSLRLCCSGGASLPAEVIRAFGERFDAVILEGYGLTETTGAATFNGIHRKRLPGYVGIPLPGSEVKIVDPEGKEVPHGERGEVVIRGDYVMKGYWKRPDATAETLRDGWLHSGDIGLQDEAGDVQIVDRKKDLVIRGGYNVYPREVEEVLYEHPDIIEVAVLGIPDDHYGEEVAAVMALRAGASFDAQEMRAWAKERLSAYKVPRVFSVVDELPKGPTGKILKRAIDKDELSSGRPVAGTAS